jgi:hypothetical protein
MPEYLARKRASTVATLERVVATLEAACASGQHIDQPAYACQLARARLKLRIAEQEAARHV